MKTSRKVWQVADEYEYPQYSSEIMPILFIPKHLKKRKKEMTMTHPPPKYKTGPTLDLSEIA
jgi:hypothetical protein